MWFFLFVCVTRLRFLLHIYVPYTIKLFALLCLLVFHMLCCLINKIVLILVFPVNLIPWFSHPTASLHHCASSAPTCRDHDHYHNDHDHEHNHNDHDHEHNHNDHYYDHNDHYLDHNDWVDYCIISFCQFLWIFKFYLPCCWPCVEVLSICPRHPQPRGWLLCAMLEHSNSSVIFRCEYSRKKCCFPRPALACINSRDHLCGWHVVSVIIMSKGVIDQRCCAVVSRC